MTSTHQIWLIRMPQQVLDHLKTHGEFPTSEAYKNDEWIPVPQQLVDLLARNDIKQAQELCKSSTGLSVTIDYSLPLKQRLRSTDDGAKKKVALINWYAVWTDGDSGKGKASCVVSVANNCCQFELFDLISA